MSDIEISLDDPNATLFKYIQQLTLLGPLNGRSDRLKRIWEPTYTLTYRDINTPVSQPRRKENTVVSRLYRYYVMMHQSPHLSLCLCGCIIIMMSSVGSMDYGLCSSLPWYRPATKE